LLLVAFSTTTSFGQNEIKIPELVPIFSVEAGRRWGYRNVFGEIAISPKFSLAGAFSDGLAPVQEREGGLFGYIDEKGNSKIEARFAFASVFSEEKASVKQGEQFGVIDLKGGFVFPARYDWIGPFRHERALIRVDKLYGFIDEKGKVVVEPIYTKAQSFSQAVASVVRDDQMLFIDRFGKEVLRPRYDECGSFHGGLAWVRKGNKFGYIGRYGDLLIPAQYDAARSFENGFAVVGTDGKFGVIDRKGKEVLERRFAEIQTQGGIKAIEANGNVISHRIEIDVNAGQTKLITETSGGSPKRPLVKLVSDPADCVVYAPTKWEYQIAEMAGDMDRVLIPKNKVGNTETSHPLRTDGVYMIIFVCDGKPCDVRQWDAGVPSPVKGVCK
jgi:hypothetical protein